MSGKKTAPTVRDALSKADVREVERLARVLDAALYAGPMVPKGEVVAVVIAILASHHIADQPDHRGAYEAFGNIVQTMVKEIHAREGADEPVLARKETVH